jgi:hypothetical protein
MQAGDFNGWSWDTPLERGEYGVWSVRLPHGASSCLPLISCCARCSAQLPAAPGPQHVSQSECRL